MTTTTTPTPTPTLPTTNEPPRCLRARSGDHWLVIDSKDVIHAEPSPRPSQGAGQEMMIAVFDSRGAERKSVPVWTLAELLELPDANANSEIETETKIDPASSGSGMIIVFGTDDRPWAVWTDEAELCESERPIAPLPETGRNRDGKRLPFLGLVELEVDLGEHEHFLLLDPRRLRPGRSPQADADVEDEEESGLESAAGDAPFDALAVPLRGESATRQILLLRVSPEQGDPESSPWLAVSGSQIVEIVETCRRVSVPTVAPHVLGIVVWRGWPTIAVDLAAWLGLPEGLMEERHRWIIARDAKGRLLAFPASQTMRSLTLPVPSDPHPIPSYILHRDRVRGGFAWDGQLLLAPDLNTIA